MSFSVGQKCKLTVSEPWDYEVPTGGNAIFGCILDIKERSIVLEADKPAVFDNGEGNLLFLRCRYKEMSDIKTLSRLTVNGGLLRVPYNNGMSEQELENQSDLVLIGGIEPTI